MMNADQIRAELTKVAADLEQLNARNLDSELAAAIVAGADVAALEAEHAGIEAQRRRARVLLAKLEADLPEAERADALAQVASLGEQTDELRSRAAKAAQAAGKAWKGLQAALAELAEINAEGGALDGRGVALARSAGLDKTPRVPFFSSVALQAAGGEMLASAHAMLNAAAAVMRPTELLDNHQPG